MILAYASVIIQQYPAAMHTVYTCKKSMNKNSLLPIMIALMLQWLLLDC